MLGYINVHFREAAHKFNALFGDIALVMISDFDQLSHGAGLDSRCCNEDATGKFLW